MPMTHTPETGTIILTPFSGAGFRYACHAMEIWDQIRLVYQIPAPIRTVFCSKPESGVVHVNKKYCTKVHNKHSS